MNRRLFLRDALCSVAALAAVPARLHAAVAAQADARFAERLASEGWLAGWKTVGREAIGPTVATVEGKLPAQLHGVLYRNGPAWFDRNGLRYRHWFDGDGMVHAWRITPGGIRHHARMVATSKFVREQRAGRFLMHAAGTSVPDAVVARNNDDLNTANTAVVSLGGRLFALWEAGSAVELDPDDLATLGPVTWRADASALPFSAHPLPERDGTLWNFGLLSFVGGSGLLIWRIGADGTLLQLATLDDSSQSYAHSFAMTDRHLVFVLTPLQDVGTGAAFFERMRFDAARPVRIAVVPKDALTAVRWFELEFAAVYHFADAQERNGEIIVRAVRYRDPEEARSPMAMEMQGLRGSGPAGTELGGIRLHVASGRARWESYGFEHVEFPSFDIRTAPRLAERIYAPASSGEAATPYFNSIASLNPQRARSDTYRYDEGIMVEEHCFVPKPRSRRPGEGWLIGTLLDYRRGRSGVAILDAEHVTDGPVALAWAPYTMPLGFHGCFVANRL